LHFIKLSHYRIGQTLRAPGGCGSQNFRQSAHEGDKAVSPMPRLPSPPPGDKPARGGVDLRAIVKSEGFGQRKIPMTPSGIETATFWLLAVPQPIAPPCAPLALTL